MVPESHRSCPIGHTIALIGDRWSLMIVREALRGVDRYDGFRQVLAISDNTLSRRLTHLQDIGVVVRTDARPGRYLLTDAGADLARVLAVVGDWGMRWLQVEPPLLDPPDAVVDAATELGLTPPGPLGSA